MARKEPQSKIYYMKYNEDSSKDRDVAEIYTSYSDKFPESSSFVPQSFDYLYIRA